MSSHTTKFPSVLLRRDTVAASWVEPNRRDVWCRQTFIQCWHSAVETAIKYVFIIQYHWPDRPFQASSQLFLSRMRHGIVKCCQMKSDFNCFHFPSVSLSLSSPHVCDYLRETGVVETEQSRIRQLYLILQSSLPHAEPCDTHAARW